MTVPQSKLAGYDHKQQVWINRHMGTLADIHRRNLTNPSAKTEKDKFDHSAYGTNGYKKLRVLDGGGHPAVALQKLVSFSGIYDFLDLKPYQAAQLVPSIRLYREIRVYNEDRTAYETTRGEIYFSNYLSEYSVEQVLNKSEALGNEVGIKEFSFDDLGKHPGVGGRVFQCKLKLYAKSLQAMAKRQYDMALPDPPESEGWYDALYASLNEEPFPIQVSAPVSVAALLVPPNYQKDIIATEKGDGETISGPLESPELVDSIIKIRIGWSVLPNSNLAIELGHGASYLNTCLALMTQEFELYFSKYDISFEEDGSVSIDIDYRGNSYEKKVEWQQDVLSGGSFRERTQTSDSVEETYTNAKNDIGFAAAKRAMAILDGQSEFMKAARDLDSLGFWGIRAFNGTYGGTASYKETNPASALYNGMLGQNRKYNIEGEQKSAYSLMNELDNICKLLLDRFVYPVLNYYGDSYDNDAANTLGPFLTFITETDQGGYGPAGSTFTDPEFGRPSAQRNAFYDTLANNSANKIAGFRGEAIADALMEAGAQFFDTNLPEVVSDQRRRVPPTNTIKTYVRDHAQAPEHWTAASLICAIATGTWKAGTAAGGWDRKVTQRTDSMNNRPNLLTQDVTQQVASDIGPAYTWILGVRAGIEAIYNAISAGTSGLTQNFWTAQASTQYDHLFAQLHNMGRVYAASMTSMEYLEGEVFRDSATLLERLNSTNVEISQDESLDAFKRQAANAGDDLGVATQDEVQAEYDRLWEQYDEENRAFAEASDLFSNTEGAEDWENFTSTDASALVTQLLDAGDESILTGTETGVAQLRSIIAEFSGEAPTEMSMAEQNFWKTIMADPRMQDLVGGEDVVTGLIMGEIEAPGRWDRINAPFETTKKVYFTYLGDVLEAVFSLHPGSERLHPKVMLGQYYYSRSGVGETEGEEYSHDQTDLWSISLADVPISISLLNKVWQDQIAKYAQPPNPKPCTCQMFVSHLMDAVNSNIFSIEGDPTSATGILDSAWAGNDVFTSEQYVAKKDLRIPGITGQTFFEWWPKYRDNSNKRLNAATSGFSFPIPFTNNDLNFSDITFIYGSNAPLPRSLAGDLMTDLLEAGAGRSDTGMDAYYQEFGPVYHLRYGADSGIVRSIDFSTLNNPHLATHFVMKDYSRDDSSILSTQAALEAIENAREDPTTSEDQTAEQEQEQEILDFIASTGAGSFGESGTQVTVQPVNLFNQAKITLIGNNLFMNGSYVYIDPKLPGMPSNIMMEDTFISAIGIGGYYIITKYSGVIKDGGFEVELEAILEFNQKVVEENRNLGEYTMEELAGLDLESNGEWEVIRSVDVVEEGED